MKRQKEKWISKKDKPLSDTVRNIIRFALFILIQVFVLDKIPHLHRSVVPYLYYLFILWVPYNTPRLLLLLIGFFHGPCP